MALAKKASMPPPGEKKPAAVIAIGIGPKKGEGPDTPAADRTAGPGKKASVADAHVVRSDQHCQNCTNYTPESGECSKVEGPFDPDDSCIRYFTPIGGHSEPDADEQGGASDQDADDMQGSSYGQ